MEATRAWWQSGCLFLSAICREEGAQPVERRAAEGEIHSRSATQGSTHLLSLVSVFVTNARSQRLLFEGEMRDHELAPWHGCPERSAPVLYLSSVVNLAPLSLATVYDTLGRELESYLREHGLNPQSAFCIATGAAGRRHLERCGFVTVPCQQYLKRYAFMRIEAATARASFWRRLLGGPHHVVASEHSPSMAASCMNPLK
jgi:hypothetical protein